MISVVAECLKKACRFKCKKCGPNARVTETVKGILPDFSQWDHFPNPKRVSVSIFIILQTELTLLIKDGVLRESCQDVVSFVFRAQSHAAGTMIDVPTPKEEEKEEGEKPKAKETRERPRRGEDRSYEADDDEDDD